MVQKFQLDASVAAYAEESARAEILKKRAEIYLGVTAVYAALVAFVTDEAAPDNRHGFALFVASFMSLVVGIVFSIMASAVTSYEVPFGAENIATEA